MLLILTIEAATFIYTNLNSLLVPDITLSMEFTSKEFTRKKFLNQNIWFYQNSICELTTFFTNKAHYDLWADPIVDLFGVAHTGRINLTHLAQPNGPYNYIRYLWSLWTNEPNLYPNLICRFRIGTYCDSRVWNMMRVWELRDTYLDHILLDCSIDPSYIKIDTRYVNHCRLSGPSVVTVHEVSIYTGLNLVKI